MRAIEAVSTRQKKWGSVANRQREAETTRGRVMLKLCSDSEQAFNEPDLADDVALRQPFHLSFANHVHGLVSGNGSDRPVGGSEPQAGGDSLLHESMILLQDIIEVR